MEQGHRSERLGIALELNSHLTDPLPVGFDLREEAMRLLREEMDPAALRTCRELYQVGLNASSALVQAVACFLLGMAYYVSGKRPSDLHRAIEQLDRSVQLFHSAMNSHHAHNEGVVWLALGVAYETLAKQNQREHWKEAIKAYQEAGHLFRMHNDPLVGWAEDAERYATYKFAEWLKIKSHTDLISRMPRPEKSSPLTEPELVAAPVPDSSVDDVVRPRPVPTSMTVFILIAVIAIAVISLQAIILGFAGLGLSVVWSFIPDLNTIIRTALAILMLVIAATLLILAVSRQLFCRVDKDTLAVYEYPRQNRIWIAEEPGRYWVDLSQAYVAAFIPRTQPVIYFFREYVTRDGFICAARITGKWTVVVPLRTWATLREWLGHRYVFGIPYPIPRDQAAQKMVEQSNLIVRDTLKQVADHPAQRKLFQSPNCHEQFQALFTQKCEHLGIRFENVQVEPYIRTT